MTRDDPPEFQELIRSDEADAEDRDWIDQDDGPEQCPVCDEKYVDPYTVCPACGEPLNPHRKDP